MKHVFNVPGYLLDRPIRTLVIGCGGTGSEMVDGLARLHLVLKALGHPAGLEITLMDHDLAGTQNVGRQRFLPGDVGFNKASVLAERYNLAYGLEIRDVPERFTVKKYAKSLEHDFDLLITCVDKAKVRVEIAKALKDTYNPILWLDCGNGRHTAQVVLGHLGGEQPGMRKRTEELLPLRLPNVADLYPDLKDVDDNEEPSCSLAESLKRQAFGINRLVADFAVFSVLTPLFTNGSLKIHGGFLDMEAGRIAPMAIDDTAWAFFGYEAPKPELSEAA